MVKINVDVVFGEQRGVGGWGLICRDDAQDIRFAAAGAHHDLHCALQAEAVALSKAVTLADRLGVGRVIFETDCMVLKQEMNSYDYVLAQLGVLFSDIRFRLRTHFIEAHVAHVVYVPRQCNGPAHVLASLGASLADGGYREWFTNYPNDVISDVTGDQALS